MKEQIYAIASALTTPKPEEEGLLELLCHAEEKRLGKLMGGKAEERQEALLCAAAFLAAAALQDSRTGSKAESFTVGDVSVKTGNGGGAKLRAQAERLLAGCGLAGEGFAFLGVRG